MTESAAASRPCSYWVSRPDRENIPLFAQELALGHLRQGWGGEDDECLICIHQRAQQGGDWWPALTDMQRAAHGNWRMYPPFGEGTIRAGDIVLVPNVPEWGRFSLVEVLDDQYHWDPIVLNVTGEGGDTWQSRDYGHMRSVRLLTPGGIPKTAEVVDARLVSTLRTPMRMWNIDYLADAIDQLLRLDDYGELVTPLQRFTSLVGEVRQVARAHGQKQVDALLHKKFQAKEFEVAVAETLRGLFPGAEVLQLGGPAEVDHGTDVLVSLANPFVDSANPQGSSAWLIPVQVKMHVGTTGDGVDQLIKAAGYWSREGRGRVLGVALLTTADELAAQERARLEAYCREQAISAFVVTRQQLTALIADVALDRLC